MPASLFDLPLSEDHGSFCGAKIAWHLTSRVHMQGCLTTENLESEVTAPEAAQKTAIGQLPASCAPVQRSRNCSWDLRKEWQDRRGYAGFTWLDWCCSAVICELVLQTGMRRALCLQIFTRWMDEAFQWHGQKKAGTIRKRSCFLLQSLTCSRSLPFAVP